MNSDYIDSHQHFWRYDESQYPWIPKGSALHRAWLPADLAALQTPLGFSGSVAVQARQSLAESHWLLGLADADPRVLGVVGWVDLRDAAVARDLELLSCHPKFVGVRHVAQDEPDEFLMGKEFQRGVALLKEFRLTYDILIYERQLPAAIQLASAFPEQQFVLDHIAKPRIKERLVSPWRERIQELAKLPNVWCKVSGMITEADHAAWQATDIRPYLDVVFDCFSPARLIYGSDWPVCLLAGSYEQSFKLATDYASSCSDEERDGIFRGNAVEFYNL